LVVEGIRAGGAALGAFTGRQRIVVVIVFAVVVALALIVFELVTGILYYSSLERRIALLGELRQLSASGAATDPQLAPIYQDLVVELNTRPTFAIFGSLSIGKFLAGASLGLFVLFGEFWLMITAKDPDWKAGLFSGGFLALALGIVGALIPDIGSSWVNVIAYVVVYAVVVTVSVRVSPPAGTTTN